MRVHKNRRPFREDAKQKLVADSNYDYLQTSGYEVELDYLEEILDRTIECAGKDSYESLDPDEQLKITIEHSLEVGADRFIKPGKDYALYDLEDFMFDASPDDMIKLIKKYFKDKYEVLVRQLATVTAETYRC